MYETRKGLQFDKSIEGQNVCVRLQNKTYRAKVTTYIGENKLNPGREMMEVRFIDIVEGAEAHEVFDAEDIFPKPGQVQCWECGSYVYPKNHPSGHWDEGMGFYCGC